MTKVPNFDTAMVDALAAAEPEERITCKKTKCVKCGCQIVAPDTVNEPLCLKCGRQ